MSVVALDRLRHARVCIAPPPDLAHAGQLNHAVIGLAEVALAATDYPLVLLKDALTGRFHLAALLGLAQNCNLFVLNSHWHATYLPLTVLRYPFFLDEGAPFGLALDEASDLICATGERLFDDQGEPTATTRSASEQIRQMSRDRAAMTAFVDDIVSRRLVRPLRIELAFEDGGFTQVGGLYSIDRCAVDALDAENLLQLNRRDYLAPMFVMEASLAQLNRLEQLHNARSARRLAHIECQ